MASMACEIFNYKFGSFRDSSEAEFAELEKAHLGQTKGCQAVFRFAEAVPRRVCDTDKHRVLMIS